MHDFGSADGIPFIAMRYVEGESLARHIARASEHGDILRLPPAGGAAAPPAATPVWTWNDAVKVLAVVEVIARALHLAHEHGVIHRDVKPANIMITPAGDPVLLDFGLAFDPESEQGVTRTGDVVGTPVYMSPEQLLSGRMDRRTDVYSLGATLYECLTLARPFTSPTRERLFQTIQRDEPADPRRSNRAINADLRLVLATAMQKEPRHRYATALDFAEDLARVRGSHPIRARPVTTVVVLSRWARRNPALAACLGALFLVLAGGLALTLGLLAEQRTTLAEWRQLADLERAETLQSWATRLWPTTPERLGGADGIDAWLAEADDLVQQAGKHAAALAQVRRGALEYDDAARTLDGAANRARLPDLAGELDGLHEKARASTEEGRVAAARIAELEALLAERRTWEFTDPEDGFRHRALAELVRLVGTLGAERAAITKRRELAHDVDRLTIEEPAAAWAAAIAVARAPDGPYRGLALRPQRGLIPLGCDRRSGLCEFAHLETGAVPARDPASGALQITPATGLVFVLLPGTAGTPDDPPEEQVPLEPFLLSKYELTQGQWLAIMGRNPSHYRPGMTPGGKPVDLRHPVETVSAIDCAELLRRLDLLLPTDAQWEYGCRAGTTTRWYTGDDPISLQGHANIADEGSRRLYPEGWSFEPGITDGHGATAPVGTYAANGLGLHDVHGNVLEWCRDGWQRSPPPARAGDGLRELPGGAARAQVFRGGRFFDRAAAVRSAWRGFGDPKQSDHTIGLRPARALLR